MVRLLVVEDDLIIQERIKKILKKLNYELLDIVDNGEQAIIKANELKPDLILMDIQIRGLMNGIEAAKIIKEQTNIPVVFATAFDDIASIENAAKVMPYGYITKPFDEKKLQIGILMALSRANDKKINNFTDLGNGYIYDHNKQALSKNEVAVDLSFQEARLLHLLIMNLNEIISYDEICNFIWNNVKVTRSSFRYLTFRLKNKIPEIPIETVKNQGLILKLDR